MPETHQMPEPAIGTLLTLTPERPAHGGALVARAGERVIFVRHGIVGETATARITGRGPKGRYFFADVVSVENPAPERRPHPWTPADALASAQPLGGMEYGHLDLATQRAYKQQIVKEQLVRLGGVPDNHPLLASLPVHALPGHDRGLHWRTRVHFAVERESQQIAMFPHSSSIPVPVTSFPLADERIEALELHRLKLAGITRVDVAVAASDMLAVVFTVSARTTPAEVAEGIEAQARALWGSLEERMITLIFTPEKKGGRRRGTKPADVIVGAANPTLLETATVYAQDFYWNVAATGFWQIHRAAPEVLGNAVLEAARLNKGMTVYDLYAGAGFFTALAADAVGEGGAVLSVEGSPVTSHNASENFGEEGPSRTHRSERTHVRVERGDVGQVLEKISGEVAEGRYAAPDVVICDPSREGAGRAVMEQISALAPQRIVYVACDPAALGRDTGYLRAAGWRLDSVEAFDMYPNTHHVEAVAVFSRYGKD
ncbi:class I SAM-dependent RNA methyltransferase [Rothia nasimurium]|uniref:class I SAM-dependent RNA methyltransferase n=1 Tax=Rothia nasimurium TaxID=85336 RepID=UPI001F2B2BD9|nr:class I SAM-dependent RNA methyltransferase [Rothia nasimurium]